MWAPTPEARAQAEALPRAPGQAQGRAVLQPLVHSIRLPRRQVPRTAAPQATAQREACEAGHQHSSTVHLALLRLWHRHTLGSWHGTLQALSGTPAEQG